ncbi:MAG: alanine racemase [Hyphomicrobiales bacterium]
MMVDLSDYPTLNPLSCGRLTVDLEAFADNWRHLRDTVNQGDNPTECGAVIKADAYGITLEKAVESLSDAGCKTYFVATPEEGIRVRGLDIDASIYILNGLLFDCSNLYKNNNLKPVLNSIDEVKEWADNSDGHPAALHIDTGMNRLGMREDEARELAKDNALIAKLNLSLLMSHLVCGGSPRSLMNGCQLSSFQEICTLFPDVDRSLCNSAGIFNGSAFHMDVVRPGIALYGGAALMDHAGSNPMKPVVKAEGRILQIRDVKEHESVGYSAAEIVDRDRTIATVACGYADGYIRQSGSTTKKKGAFAYINGYKVPLVGHVSMDLIAIDVSDVPDVKRGDYVELFGPNISISQLAGHAGTIDYEFLTSLGKRYARLYGPLGE